MGRGERGKLGGSSVEMRVSGVLGWVLWLVLDVRFWCVLDFLVEVKSWRERETGG